MGHWLLAGIEGWKVMRVGKYPTLSVPHTYAYMYTGTDFPPPMCAGLRHETPRLKMK